VNIDLYVPQFREMVTPLMCSCL